MKAAIIGASSEALHTIEIAKESGLYVIALDGNSEALGLSAADEGFVVDISDVDRVVETLRREQVNVILTVPIGRYLTTIGKANDELGLTGISEAGAIACTDKYLFHEILNKEGLRKGTCFLVKDGKEPACGGEYSYPAILKPRFGSGSRGIFYLKDEKTKNQAFKEIKEEQEDYVLEEILPGEEYGIDAIVEEDRFHLVLIRRKVLTPLPARQAIGYLSVDPQEEPELYQLIREYMVKVIKAMKLTNCLLHGDLVMEKDQVSAIEISGRPSGHRLHDLFTPEATGIDMAKEWIAYIKREEHAFEPQKVQKKLIHYFPFQGKVEQFPRAEEAELLLENLNKKKNSDIKMERWNCAISTGDILEPVTTGHSIMNRGYFILKGNGSEELLMEAADEILQCFHIKKKSLALITARGGSKRIPGKNIREFCGQPIINYSIQAALKSQCFDEVMVSTDDLQIARIAMEAGAKVPFLRSHRTSDDYASTDQVIAEVLEAYRERGTLFETFCCIYPTAPFVTAEKLIQAMDLLQAGDSVMPVVRFSYPPQRGMIIEEGKLRPKQPEYMSMRSQDLEGIYHDCGQFYACTYEAFLKNNTTDVENLLPMEMEEMEVQDIDTLQDWEIAELKYKKMISGKE